MTWDQNTFFCKTFKEKSVSFVCENVCVFQISFGINRKENEWVSSGCVCVMLKILVLEVWPMVWLVACTS